MDIQMAKEIIAAAAIADDTVIMEGKHGIGKSNIVKQFCAENDYHLEELFLSHQEVGDLIGIPHTIEQETQTITTWSVPIWLQRMQKAASEGKHCLLFLDELNRAPIDVRQSALQLVLERQIHEHALPIVDGIRTMIVAAVNPADDYQVDELDPALLDRFLSIHVEADTRAWLEWARKENKNQIVRDFLSEHTDRLHMDVKGDDKKGPTPRSWDKLCDFMDNVDKIPNEILFQVIKGKLGQSVGAQFLSFYQHYSKVVKMEDIEKVIKKYKSKHDKIEDVATHVSKLMEKTEAIQKTEMIHQMANKFMKKDDIYPFLVYLYSLEVEICVAWLKSYRQDEPKLYKKLAEHDKEINDKELFKRVVKAAAKE